MDQFRLILNTQLILFAYLAIGILCRRKRIITEHCIQNFVDFVLKITLPFMIFNSFHQQLTGPLLHEAALIFFFACLSSLAAFLLGKAAYRWCPPVKNRILQYATLVNNCGFAGLPMVSASYGESGLFLASIFIIPNRIMMWTAGISLFTEAAWKEKFLKILKNPGIIAVELGLIRMAMNIPVPKTLNTVLTAVGDCTAPLSMIVVGAILSNVKIRTVFERSVLLLSLVRLILLPVLVLALMGLSGMNDLMTGVAVVLTAIPAGATTSLLAARYGSDDIFASKCVFVTTVLSLITIPALGFFL